MRGVLTAALAVAMALSAPAARAADRAGEFDYYVAVLSWNATWCALEGDAWNDGRGADQCDPSEDIGFVLHGLWPQHERGYPEHCTTPKRDPRRSESAAMADIMGSAGLAWYQWKKHGRCSGLDPAEYFSLAREAWEKIRRPALLRKLTDPVKVDPAVIEDAFLKENPWMRDTGVSVSCRDGMIYEVRVCFTKALSPRACSGRVARECRAPSALLPPMR